MISIFTSFFFFEELDFHPLGVSRLTLRPVPVLVDFNELSKDFANDAAEI
jgi:hypothetical protein